MAQARPRWAVQQKSNSCNCKHRADGEAYERSIDRERERQHFLDVVRHEVENFTNTSCLARAAADAEGLLVQKRYHRRSQTYANAECVQIVLRRYHDLDTITTDTTIKIQTDESIPC